MPSENVIWPESPVPPAVKQWVVDFFATADSNKEGAAQQFASFFHDEGAMMGMSGLLQGKEAIYESRLQAWNTVDSRTHTIHKVYTNKTDGSDILILGSLTSTLSTGRSYEMEFAAQALFQDTASDPVEAIHYKVWADKSIAMKAADGS